MMLDTSIKIEPQRQEIGRRLCLGRMFQKAGFTAAGQPSQLEAKASDRQRARTWPCPRVPNNAGWLFRKSAWTFLSRTGGPAAARSVRASPSFSLPPALAIEAHYGITVLAGANKDQGRSVALTFCRPRVKKFWRNTAFDSHSCP